MAEPNPKKIKFETKKELLELVTEAEDITCVHCKIVPREAPIYHTSGGSIVCSPCQKKHPYGLHRNIITRAFEKMLFELPRPCKFKKNGCQVTLDLKNIEYHEEDCIHRDILCFVYDCLEIHPFENLAKHLKIEHGILDNIKASYPNKKGIFYEYSTLDWRCPDFHGIYGPYLQYGKTFYLLMEGQEIRNSALFWLMIYGSKFEAKNFKYTIECEDPEFGTICYKNCVKSLDDKKADVYKAGNGLMIPYEMFMKTAVGGGSFDLKITIENLKEEEPEFDEVEFENPSNDTQPLKEIIEKALQKPLVIDDTWFLVESKWFGQLKKHLGLDKPEGAEGSTNARPGPIDNGPLFKENAVEKEEIKDGLIEWLEYVPVPEEAWKALVKEFGLREGQPPISRKVIEQGKTVKQCKIEIYFMTFQLADSAQPEETVKKKFSKTVSLLTIQKTMKEVFQIPDNTQTRLWLKYPEKAYELLSNLDTTAQDSSLYHDQVIMIERQKSDGSWPCKNEK